MVHTKFCNVFRQRDRATQYLIAEIINPEVKQIEFDGDAENNRVEHNKEFVFRVLLSWPEARRGKF